MTKTTCLLEDCESESYVRGYCRPHYRRLMTYGDPLGERQPIPQNVCKVQGCGKDARTKRGDLCPMHYHRKYRGGVIGGPEEKIRKQRNEFCIIDGCEKPDDESGLCSMHAARLRRNGDPLKILEPHERNYAKGPHNFNWKDEPGYVAAHDRVRRAYGSASEHDCVDCGGAAYHWSYNHDDPNELQEVVRGGYLVSYSASLSHYSARCVPCHKSFDLGRIDSATQGGGDVLVS